MVGIFGFSSVIKSSNGFPVPAPGIVGAGTGGGGGGGAAGGTTIGSFIEPKELRGEGRKFEPPEPKVGLPKFGI